MILPVCPLVDSTGLEVIRATTTRADIDGGLYRPTICKLFAGQEAVTGSVKVRLNPSHRARACYDIGALTDRVQPAMPGIPVI